MRRVRAAPIAIAAAAAFAVLLSGCANPGPNKEEIRMEHEKAKAEVEELYEKTIAIVGDGWNAPESEWRGCGRSSLSGTDSWARVTQRFGPLGRSPETIAEDVATLWNTLGYPVEVVSDDTITPPRKVVSYPPYLTGTTTEGFGVVFSVGEGYADFSGYSRCVPSDPTLDTRYPS